MKIHFPKLYSVERREEPCFVSIPFIRGAFPEGAEIEVWDDEIRIPSQTRVLTRYPDGSAKYVFVRFLVNLPAGRGKDLEAKVTAGRKSNLTGLQVVREGSLLRVNGGKGGLSFELREESAHLMEGLWDGRKHWKADQFAGPRMKDGEGQVWLPEYSKWQLEEAGPIAAVLRGQGAMRKETESSAAGDRNCMDERPRFEVKLTVYAGKPWMEAAFRLINATSAPMHAASLVFSVKAEENAALEEGIAARNGRNHGDSVGEGSVAAGRVIWQEDLWQTTGTKLLDEIERQLADHETRCCVGSSNYRTNFTVSSGTAVGKTVDTASLMSEANEHFTEVFYGTFFADWTDQEGGVCATIFQAQQNYPKAVKSDANGICLLLIPEGVEKVVFESGMSREQRFQLHFHAREEKLSGINSRSLIYQMPDRPVLDAEIWQAAGVCPDIFVASERADPEVEIALINRCDAHSRSYGMLNFGDAPDMNYTQQGRGRGELVWTNNEYDFPHACALLYMRTGERRFLDYVIAAATHWMDVDVCHYSKDPLRIGGQWEHCRRHVLDSTMVCSHEWVEGLLDLYHLTGETRALRTALGIGENVRRLLETPAYQISGESNARETGWALRSLTALYLETADRGWLTRAEWIVGQFREWMDSYGSWVAPYTDNTMIHVPFMIAVAMGSLYRYYEVLPKEEIKKMLLSAAEDLLETCLTPTGLFIYKELPSLNRLGNNTLVLEALTIAWQLSGDIRFLQAGIPSFRRDMASRSGVVGKKTVREGTVLLENDPPKHFAQSYLPLALFYKAATDAGIL